MSSVSFKGLFWNISATSIKDLNGHCLVSDIIHKFTRDKYSKRFPELESLVPDSLDYIRTVKVRSGILYFSFKPYNKSIIVVWPAPFMISQELGNNLEKCKNNETLQQILTNATIMVVSVTASTTQGWANAFLSVFNLNSCILVQIKN